jgi:hypothetical protein
MDATERELRMWAELLMRRIEADSARFRLMEEAILFRECGMPIERLCDALKIDRSQWYRRVAAHEAEREQNRVALDKPSGVASPAAP